MPKGTGAARSNGRAAPPPRGRANPRRIAAMEERLGVGDVDTERESLDRDIAAAEERAVQEMQAAAEGVALTDKVEFFGEEYRLAARVGLMPMLKFAHAANRGVGADDMEGMAALYAIIRDVVYRGEPPCGDCEACKEAAGLNNGDVPAAVPGCQYFEEGDWDRFERAAIDEQADGDQLLDFVHEAIEQISARPTNARSGSSSRARSTSPKSKERSPRVVQGRALPEGAEDLRPVDELLR